MLTALYDVDLDKTVALASRIKATKAVKHSIDDLIASCDVVAECVNTPGAEGIVRKSLKAGKKVLAMSVGRLFGKNSLFLLARQHRASLVLPSGAIAGLDAIKAARLAGFRSITLTSTKPPAGFKGNAYLNKRRIQIDKITSDKVLFDGGVNEAVSKFPQNINVAAALALSADGAKVRVRIVASPAATRNTHEIFCEGKSGTIRTVTENVPCPDNPKTSYLAVLSGIQALKQLSDQVKIGT